MSDDKGWFIAALDQSGGSTPDALRSYDVPDSACGGDEKMFRFTHEMRVRIITSPAFTADRVMGAIVRAHQHDQGSSPAELRHLQ
jgi:fructose-bisphosphate aldolase, class I